MYTTQSKCIIRKENKFGREDRWLETRYSYAPIGDPVVISGEILFPFELKKEEVVVEKLDPERDKRDALTECKVDVTVWLRTKDMELLYAKPRAVIDYLAENRQSQDAVDIDPYDITKNKIALNEKKKEDANDES